MKEKTNDNPALVADLGVCGVWQPQLMSLLDIRVLDADALYYREPVNSRILATAEADNKQKYSKVVEAHKASFTPFVQSVDNVFRCEVKAFIKRLAQQLSV